MFNLMVALCSQSCVVLCSFVWTKVSHKSDAQHACCVRYCSESVGSPTFFYHLLDGCQQRYTVHTSTRGDEYFQQCVFQALQKRIWDLGLNSKNPYNGKIQALEAKLGLFLDHFWTFLGLCRYFHENERKNMQKRQKTLSRYFPCQKYI